MIRDRRRPPVYPRWAAARSRSGAHDRAIGGRAAPARAPAADARGRLAGPDRRSRAAGAELGPASDPEPRRLGEPIPGAAIARRALRRAGGGLARRRRRDRLEAVVVGAPGSHRDLDDAVGRDRHARRRSGAASRAGRVREAAGPLHDLGRARRLPARRPHRRSARGRRRWCCRSRSRRPRRRHGAGDRARADRRRSPRRLPPAPAARRRARRPARARRRGARRWRTWMRCSRRVPPRARWRWPVPRRPTKPTRRSWRRQSRARARDAGQRVGATAPAGAAGKSESSSPSAAVPASATAPAPWKAAPFEKSAVRRRRRSPARARSRGGWPRRCWRSTRTPTSTA